MTRLGDLSSCVDCNRQGVVVCTDGNDFDANLRNAVPKTIASLEMSAFDPRGLVCENCERGRFQGVLPTRGICAACGTPNAKALKEDLGASRSFCNTDCINLYLNRRLAAEGRQSG